MLRKTTLSDEDTMHPLTAYRKARKLKIDDVVKETGLSKASISRIERGKQQPSADSLRRLCQFTAGLLRPNDFFNVDRSA
ncbi:helix-turn-helix transcriptional regulator [Shinella sp.]|uniref:helix-turn-helix domain-containing protein n=1 Tax=Shinella sp. TaxID=1870904 RepID=UPI00301DDE6C